MKRKFEQTLPNNALRYVLEGLVPYTAANAKLALKPAKFFADLEKISGKKRRTLQNAYYNAVSNGTITFDDHGRPNISEHVLRSLKPFEPIQLQGSCLMVVFDIAESERWKRQQLRLLLKQLRFTQIQKSVWQTTFDSREYLIAEVKRQGLQNNVLVYEAAPLI